MLMAKKKPTSTKTWHEKLALLQERLGIENNRQLADRLGVSLETLRSWRYRHKVPSLMAQKFINELLSNTK